ncbi:Nance-Horan syndrome protein isoform X1 [Oryzias melastigma]|uniref:Nance-Horan syndrome a (congenital cataracts and dental anomalies) n=1 Tax=Oryzias melastigma TaxID=30732 RepID=A0A3B3BGE7_ORYME|nr:Nance-Horan syndrome protein isoform X1 [Oryzias melastigma]
MPFAKRVVEPQFLCRYQVPNEEGLAFEDLVSISNVALSRTLRQLSDLAKHACSIFQELEVELTSTKQRLGGLHGRLSLLQQTCNGLDPKEEAVPVSNLDVESKLTEHFQSSWLQQRNLLNSSTRPACIEDLHKQASLSLWALNRDHQRASGSGERRVTISALPPMPLYPSSSPVKTLQPTRSSSPTECCRLSPWSRKAARSDPDTDGVALGHRSKLPIPNTPSTLDKQTNWSRALPLPTPEERMKSSSQVISSCIIPINVTGVGFDRDASVRCSLVHSQSVLQRRRKLRRRRTVAGVPRQVHPDLDSDESPGSRERTVIVHASLDLTPSREEISTHLTTRDSGCQTEDFLISGAPSRRKIRSQRGQGISLLLSHSAGNISSLADGGDGMFSAPGAQLRSRSLPRDTSRLMDDEQNNSDNEEELSLFNTEDFMAGHRERILKEEEESTDDQAGPEHRKYKQLSDSPERCWMERSRGQLPRSSCEISSSSDTFSSPVHSVSAAGGLGGQMDHKEDHQSSSGNWSGSSSTCPSQTSETIPPAASPPLTSSSHCDSELSLNAASHAAEDATGFMLDHYQGLRTQRVGSFSSTAMDILEEVGAGTPIEGEWGYPHADPPHSQGFSPEPSREAESSLGCPSFTSMATCESSFSDKPPSEKADTVSHYSVDTEGYYTSMHFDCGLKGSRSFTYSYAPSDCGLSDSSPHLTLGRRCLSLRKPKVKPSPPKRSSSLRKICSEGSIPDTSEPKIFQRLPLTSKERKLQLLLSGSYENSSQIKEPLVAWGVEGSTLPGCGLYGSSDARLFRDCGIAQSDEVDLWLLNDYKSSDPYRSLSNSSTATGTTVIECMKSQEGSESQASQSGSRSTTPSLPSVEGEFKLTSPEKLAGLASPSSGYSSQSETPTSSFPNTFFPGPLSPAGTKRKPKVPERKSSLSSLSLQTQSGRDGVTSKRDLELPVTPPSHLDLSALHSGNSKASACRSVEQNLHENKQNASISAKPPNSEQINAHPLLITPSVLNSVQLRTVSKENEEGAVRISSSKLSSSRSFELKSPSLNHQIHPYLPTKKSTFTSSEELRSETLNQRDKEESNTTVGLRPEPSSDLKDAEILERSWSDEGEMCAESADTSISSADSEAPQELAEPPAGDPCPSPPVLHSSPKRCSSLDKVPAADGQLEASRDSEAENSSSGVSAESASQDGGEESTAEREDSFSKESSLSDSSVSPLHDESRPEEDSVFVSPTKSRTTEDLFAMIHRSKRKVLGRKDSTELGGRSRLGAASGNTPPGSTGGSPPPLPSPPSAATPPSLHKVSSPIYRSVKKSSTSNEEFKLLLLRKGSRSDSSYRMSAAEILKSPVTPKPPADFLTESPRQAMEPASPLLPPALDQLSSPYPKANADSFSPKSFFTAAASRQSRSRIPPPASSSRYSVRSRMYSTPMQAISEGEAENSDGSPHDDRSSQGST